MSGLIATACRDYGSERVLVSSFTKAAAKELVMRDLPLNDDQVGTLHALCYRALDRPKLATGSILKDWNDEHPHWSFDTGTDSLDDPYGMEGAKDGDKLLQEYNRFRGLQVSADAMPCTIQPFAQAWQDFKSNTFTLDFTDLIATCLSENVKIPHDAAVLFLDEVQDFSRLELALARHWGKDCEELYLCGDPNQCLYGFKGATPDSFLHPPLPPERSRVLSQSYRVPRAVHESACRWIEGASERTPGTYRPRDFDGKVSVLQNLSYDYMDGLSIYLDDWLKAGKTVALLAACSYMIDPVKKLLREWGLPFHNPYRRCSPPDEPILTDLGWIPIAKLDSAVHRLAGFHANTNALSWGGRWDSDLTSHKPSGIHAKGDRRGFAFTVGSRSYTGMMLTLTTAKSKTRVTPNHRVRARYAKDFYGKWAVYLMRRGNHWRIGISHTGSYPFRESGIAGRLTCERADGAWILSIHSSRKSAILAETKLQIRYGITGLTFRKHPGSKGKLTQADIDEHHEDLSDIIPMRAADLLRDCGLEEMYPLIIRDGERRRRTGTAFETVAANLLTGYMEIPVMPDQFERLGHPRISPEWYSVSVTKEQYTGTVYSLDVPGPEHYISGRAIVHNSRGDWNPLAQRAGTVNAAQRVLSFLKLSQGQWWTYQDLWNWASMVEVKGVFAHGAKTEMRRKAEGETAPVSTEDLDRWFVEEVAAQAAQNGDITWLQKNLLQSHARPIQYACSVLEKSGRQALSESPKLIIGTVHSVKGGEADIVVLCPDLSPLGMEEWIRPGESQDAIRRLFYVGMTRAKEELYWTAPSSPRCIAGYV